jgi:molecular chaperone DnaK
MSEAVIGIDLGTTNSAVATLDAHGFPMMLGGPDGELTTPSAVYFDPSGEVVVGRAAREAVVYDPARVALYFKREMANAQFAFGIDGHTYTPTDLSAEVLGGLVAALPPASGSRKAVITVPAYFHNPQREATVAAGQQAGLEVIGTINEPTAAALAYGLAHPELTGTILVYDLGGGTFDVTLIDYAADAMRVIGSDGDHHLGGVLWDERLMELVADRFSAAHGVDLLADHAAVADLRLACEQAKFSLSAREQVRVPVRCDGRTDNIAVTRAEFEEATLDYLDRTRSLIVRLIRETGVPWPKIDATVLVGGSTRMPAVRELISGLARKQPLTDINPDECVAQGAALWAATQVGQPIFSGMLGGRGASSASGRGLRVMTDVSPHSLGYVQESADGHRYINGTVIRKNTPLPTVQTRPSVVRTRAGSEGTQSIYVLQGDAERVLDNELGGCHRVSEIPHYDGETTVDIGFGYDVSGIIRVSAKDARSGRDLVVEAIGYRDDLLWTDGDPSVAPAAQPMTIMMVIDTSGSMSGTGITEAKAAAREFLDQLDLSFMPTGIAEFGGHAGIVISPTNGYEDIIGAINGLGASNGTPMAEGLSACAPVFQEVGEGVVVLLTDGAPNDPAAAERAACTLKELGVVIYTVGTSGANLQFLRGIASDPDKTFEPGSGELNGTFRSIGREVASGHLRVK